MANIYTKLLTRGLASELASKEIEDGKFRFAIDSEQLYIDYNQDSISKRIHISDLILGLSDNAIHSLESPLEEKFYLASDSQIIYFYENSAWNTLNHHTPSMTFAEYEALPDSKESDNILRIITDINYPVENSLADLYDNTSTYTAGDYCVYNEVFYKCIATISSPENFNPAHWVETKMADEIQNSVAPTAANTTYIDTVSQLGANNVQKAIEVLAENIYELPPASDVTLGGIKVGSNLTMDPTTSVLSATDTTYQAATTSVDGLLSASDKSKLDGIEANANNYELPTASESVLGGVKVDNSSITISNGIITSHYSLPQATAALLGGVYVDTSLSPNSVNPVQNQVITNNFYTKTDLYTKAEINTLIGQISTLNIEVVETLPTTGISATTIYLVPKTVSETQNVYDEFVYVNNAWEKIGDTEIDLSNYLQLNGNGSNITATFTQASTLSNITSGETLSGMMSKISKSIADFTSLKSLVGSSSMGTTATTVTGAINELRLRIVELESMLNGCSLWIGTQAQYDAITTKSDTTIYHIKA